MINRIPSGRGRAAERVVRQRARWRRQYWARRFRPAAIDLLLVAEAPPSSLDRYFYFPDVASHDSLFHEVARAVLKVEPDRASKRVWLGALKAVGLYLIDLSPDPTPRDEDLGVLARRLPSRIRLLQPRAVILVKTTVYDAAAGVLQEAHLPLVDERIPFPGSGRQREFHVAFARALRRAKRLTASAAAHASPRS